MNRFIVASTLLTLSSAAVAEGTPWLPQPGSTTASLSYVFQTADEFYIAADKNDLPDDLEQATTALSLDYGVSDQLSVDFKTGYARTTFEPEVRSHISGRTDTNVGVNWRFIDEFTSEHGLPSTVLRVGAIIEGNYRTNAINAIGDGGDGIEASLISGKFLNSWSAVSGEIGYRNRSSDIPDEAFYKANLYVFPVSGLVASLGYSISDAQDGFQLSDADFTPERFPDLEEENEVVTVGLSYSFTKSVSAGINVARVVDGRNTANTEAYGLTVSYTH